MVVGLVVAASATAAVRLQRIGYDLSFMIPEVVWQVTVVQSLEGHGERVRARTFLPISDDRQTVLDERNQSGDLELDIRVEEGNRAAHWTGPSISGARTIQYEYRVLGRGRRYEIADGFELGARARGASTEWLQPTKVVQSASPEILELSDALLPADRTLVTYVRAVFDRVSELGFKPFKGTTDALTALRLGEASCNGRGRLFVALMRARGIPARLIGGLVLEPGEKRTSHQWVEIAVGGHWVPMDPTNDHFAELPHNYLTLYRGDHALFRHTADIGFRYSFSIRRRLAPRRQTDTARQDLGLWAVFEKLGIPLDLLKIVIMIPLGAVVVVIFRNVLGLRTFGTFLPALIAAAAVNTGFWWGAIGFVVLLLLASGVRRLCAHLELLHSPQLAVLLTAVIGAMLLTAFVADAHGLARLARISLFPVAILAITAERFTLVEIEEGPLDAWATLLRTLVVVYFCHLTMSSLALQILMLGFPELLLVVVAIDIWLGRWMGLRLTEWVRFRGLLRPKGANA